MSAVKIFLKVRKTLKYIQVNRLALFSTALRECGGVGRSQIGASRKQAGSCSSGQIAKGRRTMPHGKVGRDRLRRHQALCRFPLLAYLLLDD